MSDGDGKSINDLLSLCLAEDVVTVVFSFRDALLTLDSGIEEPQKCMVSRRPRNKGREIVYEETGGRLEMLITEHAPRPTDAVGGVFPFQGRRIPYHALSVFGGWEFVLQIDLKEPSDGNLLMDAKERFLERWRPAISAASVEAGDRVRAALKAATNMAALNAVDVEALLHRDDEPPSY